MRFVAAAMVICGMAGAVGIIATYDAPDLNIRGLAFANEQLYAVDSLSGKVYCIDPSDGSVISEWSTGYLPNKALGMGATPSRIWISFTNSYIRYYTLTGTFQGAVNLCGS